MFPAARDPFLTDSANSAFKWTLFNARLTKMRCWHLRPGCDFGRTFAHHFGVVFGLVFEYFFGPAEERRFAGISVFSVFGAAARTCF
jgi:hypothetical protein